MRKSLRTADHASLIELLHAARKEAGLTQQQVADELRVPQSFVAKYEGGERRLDILEFIAIARALKIDPLALLGRILVDMPVETALGPRRTAPRRKRRDQI